MREWEREWVSEWVGMQMMKTTHTHTLLISPKIRNKLWFLDKEVISSRINFEWQSLDEFKGKSNIRESRIKNMQHLRMLEVQLLKNWEDQFYRHFTSRFCVNLPLKKITNLDCNTKKMQKMFGWKWCS